MMATGRLELVLVTVGLEVATSNQELVLATGNMELVLLTGWLGMVAVPLPVAVLWTGSLSPRSLCAPFQ